MRILLGWDLGGPSFSERDVDLRARLGEPVWGPGDMLRDLHLRLGLPPAEAAASVRVPRWAARIEALGDTEAFYARSFKTDALGTARTLLAWRDALVEAGWDGSPIAGGGDRLMALARIEAQGAIELPAGRADRLARVEAELSVVAHRIYDSITLVEERALWSRRWQRIFARLEQLGTELASAAPALPGAAADTDLGLLQRLLRGEAATAVLPAAIRGDGTLLVLRGETGAELAALTASILATHDDALVVRSTDAGILESALQREGLAGQGYAGSSGARPAMQVLPLALELAFEPRDPYRVLELLTLPVGPFQGLVGSKLARAVSKQPGIGGQEWTKQRERVAEALTKAETKRQIDKGLAPDAAEAAAATYVAARLDRVREWLETPGAGPEGAPRTTLLALATRVRTWLQKRLGAPSDDAGDIYGAAFAQAQAFTEALTTESRTVFTREEARHLLDTVVRSAEGHVLSIERAGRIPHVRHPGAILAPARNVVFWGFVASAAKRPALLPWNRAERAALDHAGVVLPDPARLLQADAAAWRRGVLAAKERVLLVIPAAVKGEATSPHPMWDEIAARLQLDEPATGRITRHAGAMLADDTRTLAKVTELPPLDLPGSRTEWRVPPELLADNDERRGAYATALEKLAGCPLAWVLEHRAGLRKGAIAKVAGGPMLNGNLSHRLVEELHKEGAFTTDDKAFAERVGAVLERLIATEGATLLLPGGAFERTQLRVQIARAMRELRRYLDDAGFRIAGVEESISIDSAIGTLTGRLDVRLVDAEGKPAVLDLKWGASSYRELLEKGRAVQLAIYARALRAGADALPPAAYFAISSARVLTTDPRMKAKRPLEGPTLEDTWTRVDRTAAEVLKSLGGGKIYVAAKKTGLPLLGALGVPEEHHDQHYATEPEAPCTYCDYPALCGRSWEGVQ